MPKLRPHILSLSIIILTALLSFWNINQIFFQQDEWLGLGGAIYRQETFGTLGSITQIFNFQTQNESIRFLPVTSLLNFFVYNKFGLNIKAYSILALVLIISCAIALNITVQKLTNSYLLSTLVSTLWITNNLAYQAFTWIGTLVPTLISTLSFILGLYFLLLYNEKRKTLYIILSFLSVLISLLSKEYSYFYIFPYIAIIMFFFRDRMAIQSKLRLILLFLIPLLISVFLPRAIYLLHGQTNFAPSMNSVGTADIIYNIFLLPAKSLFHIFFSSSLINQYVYSISRIIFQNYTDGFIISRIVGDAFSLLIAFYILLFIALVLAMSNKENKALIIFSLFSFFTSFAPFVVFMHVGPNLEPRFYILPAIFSSLLTVSIIRSLFNRFRVFSKVLVVFTFIPLLLFNIHGVRQMLTIDIRVGKHRREMLNTVSEVKPYLAKDNIFYFFTAHTGFWEFQSGFGQTLAVWLYDSGKVPKEALIDRDFWDLSYEGLKQYSTGKYGYFMTYNKLRQALKENPDVSFDHVHAYYWDYQKYTVKNVSEEIREKLKKDASNEKISQ